MNKFKVGDKVRIVNPRDDKDMNLIGYEFIVDDVDMIGVWQHQNENIDDYWWNEEIELVEESKIDGVWEINGAKYGLELKVNGFTIDPDIKVDNNLITRGYDGFIGITQINNNKEKGEKDMNKVLELYLEKKLDLLKEKYDNKVQEDFDKIEVIEKYEKIRKEFEESMDELFNSVENFDNDYIKSDFNGYLYKYKVNKDDIIKNLKLKYADDYAKEKEELDNLVKEVNAQLSMSNDLDYQVEILTLYGILDKKTKKMAE